jgi:hypothetical protein
MSPKLIYVSSPYSAPTQDERWGNVLTAIKAGIVIRLKGNFPVIPHLYDDFDEVAKALGIEFTWQDYIDMDTTFLSKCDAILYLGSSKGADIELSVARDMKIPIYYSVDEVPEFKPFVASSFKDSSY